MKMNYDHKNSVLNYWLSQQSVNISQTGYSVALSEQEGDPVKPI